MKDTRKYNHLIDIVRPLPKLKRKYEYKVNRNGGVVIYDVKSNEIRSTLYLRFATVISGEKYNYDEDYLEFFAEPIYEKVIEERVILKGFK